MSVGRKYYVPSVVRTTGQPATRIPGDIFFSAPYTSAYTTSGSRRIYIYLDGQRVAQSGLASDFFSYPYSCVTYIYGFQSASNSTYPIDPPFGVRTIAFDGDSPSMEIGTHYGRGAIALGRHGLLSGLWSVHQMPANAVKVYSSTHLFPWERGYAESPTPDWMLSVRVVYKVGSEVLAWTPVEYSTQAYSYGVPAGDVRFSLMPPNGIQ